jgi:hypothetical protein
MRRAFTLCGHTQNYHHLSSVLEEATTPSGRVETVGENFPVLYLQPLSEPREQNMYASLPPEPNWTKVP